MKLEQPPSKKNMGMWNYMPVSKLIGQKDKERHMKHHWKRILLHKGRPNTGHYSEESQYEVFMNRAEKKERKRVVDNGNKILVDRLTKVEARPGTYNKEKLEKTWNVMRRDKYIKARRA
jgi:hypothetical protein